MERKKLKLNLFPFENLPLELQLIVFKYFTPKERRDNLSFVSKSWTENLQSFTEDYQLHLYNCYLKEEIDPFSVLIKSTRKYRFLKLGKHFTSENPELVSRLLGHLGKHVRVLEIASTDEILLLKDLNPLLMFPKLKKLIVTKISDLKYFDFFPESLEHIHVKELSVVEPINEIEHLKKIKNLRFWTSELIKFKIQKNESSTTILTVDEKLKEILESLQTLDNINLKVSTNFIGTPVVQIDDVIGIKIKGKPKKFLTFIDLPNLKSIIYSGGYGFPKLPCLNNHEVNICLEVEEFEISCYDNLCIKCFTTSIDGFPNLKKLAFSVFVLKNEQFDYVCSKLPQLKDLKVGSSHIDDQILFNALGNFKELHTLELPNLEIFNIEKWPFMPNLKKLKVYFPSKISRTNFKVFCEKLPNIQSFHIYSKPDIDDDSFVEILTHHWKNLKTFKMQISDFSQKDFDNIILNCKKLRTIDFARSRNVQSSWVYHFFRDIPCLRRFRGIYRKDYYHMKHLYD